MNMVYTLKRSAKEKSVENQETKPSFKLTD